MEIGIKKIHLLLLASWAAFTSVQGGIVCRSVTEAAATDLHFGEMWRRMMLHSLQGGSPRANALRELGGTHPELSNLRRLGLRITETEIIPPLLDEAVARYLALVYGREHTLRPGRIIRLADGERSFIGILDPLPAGGTEIDITRVSPNSMGQMMAAGFFPMSSGRAYHDFIGHFAAFARFENYTTQLFLLARDFGDSSCRVASADRYARLRFFLEGLALVPPTNRPALLPLLTPILQRAEQEGERLVTVTQVKQELHGQSIEWIRQHTRALLRETPYLLEIYGGAERELGAVYRDYQFGAVSAFVDQLRSLVDGPSRALVQKLAQVEVALLESSRISLAQYAEELRIQWPGPDSRLHRFYVQSGVFGSNSILYRSITGDALFTEEF